MSERKELREISERFLVLLREMEDVETKIHRIYMKSSHGPK